MDVRLIVKFSSFPHDPSTFVHLTNPGPAPIPDAKHASLPAVAHVITAPVASTNAAWNPQHVLAGYA